MDNEKQKQEVIDFLESTYTGAKMMGDDEVMLRASRALLAFKADVHKDIFHRGECAGVLIPERERILGSSFFFILKILTDCD